MAAVNFEGMPWCPEQEAQLTALLAAGTTTKEVARLMGRTPAAIALRAKRLGLKRKNPQSPNTIMARRLLSEEALTPHQLAAKLGLHKGNVYRIIRVLRAELYIVKWERGRSGPPVPYYTRGEGIDAKRPKPTPMSVLQRRYTQRMKEERPADYYAKVRKSNAKRPRKVRADAAAAWIVPQQGE